MTKQRSVIFVILLFLTTLSFCRTNKENEICLLETEETNYYGNKVVHKILLDTIKTRINVYRETNVDSILERRWTIISDSSLVYYDEMSGPVKWIIKNGLLMEEKFAEYPLKLVYRYDNESHLIQILREPDFQDKPYWVKQLGIKGFITTPVFFKWNGDYLQEVKDSISSDIANDGTCIYKVYANDTTITNMRSPLLLNLCGHFFNTSIIQSALLMYFGIYGSLPIAKSCSIFKLYQGQLTKMHKIKHSYSPSGLLEETTVEYLNEITTIKYRWNIPNMKKLSIFQRLENSITEISDYFSN